MASVTSDVAELESLVESLTAENRILSNTRVQNEFEITMLRRRNGLLQDERDKSRDAMTQMKMILDEAGAAIVHGMKRFQAVQDAQIDAPNQAAISSDLGDGQGRNGGFDA